MEQVRSRAYRDGHLVAEGFPLEEVSEYLDVGGTIVWLDLCAPTAGRLRLLADELGLHELAVEDALGPHQRPKLDHYPSHVFLACHAAWVDVERAVLHETEVDAFFDTRWLITVRKDDGFAIEPVLARWDRSEQLAHHGVSYLLYGLLDVIVDGYFNAVDAFDQYFDEISDRLFEEQPMVPAQQRQWFDMRRAFVRLHRLVVPMREVVSGLMRREQRAVPEQLYPYFQDLYDHVLRVTESVESLRDLSTTIVETNLSLRDYRQNQVMKKVTSWAAIIAVPTLITGFFGMNVPYPGSGQDSGVLVSVALMAVISGGLYLLFRRKDWL